MRTSVVGDEEVMPNVDKEREGYEVGHFLMSLWMTPYFDVSVTILARNSELGGTLAGFTL